jgi:hypothetical protein
VTANSVTADAADIVRPTGAETERARAPKRLSRFRFSLRSLLVAMGALSIVFWLIGLRLSDMRSQERAAKVVESHGANLYWRFGVVKRVYWKQGFLGGDRDLEFLTAFTSLEELELKNCLNLSDSGVSSIGKLLPLRELTLSGANISDQNVASLAGLSRLQTLRLDRTRITDRGIASLSTLGALRELDLGGTDVGDGAVETLLGMKSLETVNVSGTKVSPEGVEKLLLRHPLLRVHGTPVWRP